MEKVVIMVPANFLKLRIEKLLPHFESVQLKQRIGNKGSEPINKDVSLIIIDLDDTNHNSIETILEIRSQKNRETIPIIALGNSGQVSIISKAIISGCNEFILKPFDDETFVTKVAKQLELYHIPHSHAIQTEKSDQDKQMILKWSSDYKIGIKAIDDEHKMIIDSFAKLYSLMKNGHGHEYYQEMLIFLTNYVDFHFKNEEALQLEMGFPIFEEHHKIHENYRKIIISLCGDQKNRMPNDEDLIQFNLWIRNFLKQHILIEDKKIGEFYANIIKG